MPSPVPQPPHPTGPPRVVIADPDAAAREARVDALRDDGFTVCAQTGDGGEAAELARYYRPDLLLLSSRLNGQRVLDAARAVLAQVPEIGIVVLALPDEHAAVAPGAFRAGIRGVLSADAPAADVHAALRAVHAGHGVVPAGMLVDLLPVAGHGFRPIAGPLSNREWEIVDLLIADCSVLEIADRLVLTEATVRSHLKHMYRKMDVHSRSALVEAAKALFAPPGDDVSPPPG